MSGPLRVTAARMAVFLPAILVAACGGGSSGDEAGGNASGGMQSSGLRSPATPVGESLGIAVAATIGPAGGAITTDSGELTLTIPRGALTDNVEIAIESIESMAPGSLADAYRMTPDGQAFDAPVTLRFAYTDFDLMGAPPEALGIATQNADGSWQWLDGLVVDTNAETISATTTHFTDYAPVTGFQIRPFYRKLKPGESSRIVVDECFENTEFGFESLDELAQLPTDLSARQLPEGQFTTSIRCREDSNNGVLPGPLVSVGTRVAGGWSVNGIAGGNGALGTIVGSADQVYATYTAPDSVPDPNTVTVSADVPWGDKGKLVVTGLIEIDDTEELGYEGELRYTDSGRGVSISVIGNIIWVDNGPGSNLLSKTFVTETVVDAKIQLEGCNLFNRPVTINGSMYFNVPADGRYSFALGTSYDDAVLSCNGIPLPYSVMIMSPPCEGVSEAPLLGAEDVLSGAVSCGSGRSLRWNFRRSGL
jgi:hypothetical protein